MPAVIASFSFWRLGDPLPREIGGPEGLRDDDVGVEEFTFEHRIGAVLVRGHDKAVPAALEEFAEAQLARDGAEEFARLEVDGLRRWQRLPARIALELRDIVARVRFGMTADGIVVENADDFHHAPLLCHWAFLS